MPPPNYKRFYWNYPDMRQLLIVFLLFCIPDIGFGQARPSHLVKAGETLFAISRQYSVTVDDIKKWNNLTSNTISTGQRLFVGPPAEQAAASTSVQHQVRPGETLFTISRRYGVTITEITEWNGLGSTTVETGQILVIQRSFQNVQQTATVDTTFVIAQEVAPSAYYVVKRGDALSKVAEQFGISMEEIRELNKLRTNTLSVGKILLIRRPEAIPAIGDADSRTGPQGRFVRYSWKRDDALSALLARSGMSESEFSALNPDVDINSIRPDDEVILLLPPSNTYVNPYRASRPDPNALGFFTPSRYPDSDVGKRLTSGDLYVPERLTAGHNTIPLGSIVYVEHPVSGIGLFVLVNDRILEAEMRLSKTAFDALGLRAGQQQTVRIYDQDS